MTVHTAFVALVLCLEFSSLRFLVAGCTARNILLGDRPPGGGHRDNLGLIWPRTVLVVVLEQIHNAGYSTSKVYAGRVLIGYACVALR